MKEGKGIKRSNEKHNLRPFGYYAIEASAYPFQSKLQQEGG